MSAYISYENLADSATITNSSDGAEVLSNTNVQTRQLGKPFRQMLETTSPLESVILDLDLGSAKNVRLVAILGHTVNDGTYAVALGTTSGASDVASASGTLWQGCADDPKHQFIILPAVYSARYVRVTVTPPSGQNVDIGRIWIDAPWSPAVAAEFRHTVQDASDTQRSIGQSAYAFERKRVRSNTLMFNNLTEVEALGSSSNAAIRSAHHMDMTAGLHAPVICIPATTGADSTQVIHKLGIYGAIQSSTPLEVMPVQDASLAWRWRKTFTVTEEL